MKKTIALAIAAASLSVASFGAQAANTGWTWKAETVKQYEESYKNADHSWAPDSEAGKVFAEKQEYVQAYHNENHSWAPDEAAPKVYSMKIDADLDD